MRLNVSRLRFYKGEIMTREEFEQIYTWRELYESMNAMGYGGMGGAISTKPLKSLRRVL